MDSSMKVFIIERKRNRGERIGNGDGEVEGTKHINNSGSQVWA